MKRRWRWPALVLVLVVGVLLIANATGVAPVSNGPLGGHEVAAPDPGGVSTLNYVADRPHIYLTPLVENTGPVPVTIVRVTPVGVTVPGSVRVIGSLPFNMDDPAERGPDGMDTITLGVQPDPGPGWDSPQPVIGVAVDPEGRGPAPREGVPRGDRPGSGAATAGPPLWTSRCAIVTPAAPPPATPSEPRRHDRGHVPTRSSRGRRERLRGGPTSVARAYVGSTRSRPHR